MLPLQSKALIRAHGKGFCAQIEFCESTYRCGRLKLFLSETRLDFVYVGMGWTLYALTLQVRDMK